jgi:oligopeptide/dipeptide ABC transporter ATP-binding protein
MLKVENLGVSTILDTKVLVDGVSFEIAEGESVGIVGESGSGKSLTALSILALLPNGVKRESGTVSFKGEVVDPENIEEIRKLRGDRIAMIYQDPMTSLNPMMKIGKQIEEVLVAHNLEVSRERILEALASVKIPNPDKTYDSYPHEFSGGMRQRVMIAMALLLKPNLLIADEPTTALDVTIQRQIINLVAEQKEKNKMSVLWISHDLGVVAELVDRVIVMYAGRIVEIGTVEEIFKNPHHPYTVGLIGSLVKREHQQAMISIPGVPPKPWTVTSQCGFADRCSQKIDRCTNEKPNLRIEGNGLHACFNPVMEAMA